jgi:hypothetical protein
MAGQKVMAYGIMRKINQNLKTNKPAVNMRKNRSPDPQTKNIPWKIPAS